MIVTNASQMPTNRLWREFSFRTYVFPNMAHTAKRAHKAVCGFITVSYCTVIL